MVSLEEMESILEELANGFPEALFKGLNGGILLLPDTKVNTAAKNNDLFVLGEYHRGGNMGRYISIYYGSFMKVHGGLDRKHLAEKLAHTLKHEFTHHLESLAGEKGLEIEDAKRLENYLKKMKSEGY